MSATLDQSARADQAELLLATPLGAVKIVAGHAGISELCFIEDGEAIAAESLEATHEPGYLADVGVQVLEYLEGEREQFDLDLDTSSLGDFQLIVLEQCSEIDYGQTLSYGELAEKVGLPGAARAVGQALAGNPLCLVIPCHRVIASDGSLGGYAGGLERKTALLELEQN